MENEKAIAKSEPSSNVVSLTESLRLADAIAKSTIIPREFQGNPSNCLIAIEMANRINASVLAVMQSLYIVHSKPSWSGQFIIGVINNSRRFKHELRFQFSEDKSECVAYTVGYDGTKLEGPKASIAMAKAEGWFGNNKKWQTMPELMLRYRSGTFFGRTYCPDLLLGMREEYEIIEADAVEVKKPKIPGHTKDMIHDAAVGDGGATAAEPVVDTIHPAVPSPGPEPAPPKPPEPPKQTKARAPKKKLTPKGSSRSERPMLAAMRELLKVGGYSDNDFMLMLRRNEWDGWEKANLEELTEEQIGEFLSAENKDTVIEQMENPEGETVI